MSRKILIVDDEVDIVEFIRYNLEKEDYVVEVAHNGVSAVKKAKKFLPELILMDVMMPELDGIGACKEIRSFPELDKTFVMFLTARNEEFSEIAAFEAGGNDYVHKPIRPKALMSRINSIMSQKESEVEKSADVLSMGTIEIDPNTRIVQSKGRDLHLPKKEFELLYLLASKLGKVLTREKILKKVWGDDVFVVDRTIDVHIRKLREKLGDNTIETIKGVGYRFVGD